MGQFRINLVDELHVILLGSGMFHFVLTESQELVALTFNQGDIISFPRGIEHRFKLANCARMVCISHLVRHQTGNLEQQKLQSA